jgi:hypothetical protein
LFPSSSNFKAIAGVIASCNSFVNDFIFLLFFIVVVFKLATNVFGLGAVREWLPQISP